MIQCVKCGKEIADGETENQFREFAALCKSSVPKFYCHECTPMNIQFQYPSRKVYVRDARTMGSQNP